MEKIRIAFYREKVLVKFNPTLLHELLCGNINSLISKYIYANEQSSKIVPTGGADGIRNEKGEQLIPDGSFKQVSNFNVSIVNEATVINH